MRGLSLPMKTTAPVDIVKNLEYHIKKKTGKDVIPTIHPTLEEMQKLRNSLDYNKIRTMITSDVNHAPEFEQQIINYLHYVYLIDNYFKSDFSSAKTLKLSFPWTDSFQFKKVKEMNHIKFELVSCLYNLAICYYTEGIAFTSNPNAQEKLKGIAKLRIALWCIEEIRQYLPNLLTNPADIPSDLNPSYINLLYNYFIGLTYATLADITSADAKKNGPEKLATIHKAASKHFQIAFNIIAPLKPCPIPEPHSKYLKLNLIYNTVMLRSEALFQMAQIHLAKVDDEVRQGHMGIAVSYLRLSKLDFDEVLKTKGDLDFMTPDQKASFLERANFIKTKYDDCLLKNQRVYLQPEYNADQLRAVPEEKTVITPLEPRDIKKTLEAEKYFEIFMAPEILMLKNEFTNAVNKKMTDTENILKNANNVKNKLYAEGYVNYLLDLHSQAGGKKVEIPPQLKAKIDKFKKIGAVNAYIAIRKNTQELNACCGKMFHDIKASLAAEKTEDENLRRQYPGSWTRPYSEQVNQEYVLKLKEFEQKFYIAQNTDNDVFKKFDQYQGWMQKLSLPDDQILALMPKSNDPEFFQQVKGQVMDLVELNKTITGLVDLENQTAALIALTEDFFTTDFISSFAAIYAKTVDKQIEFEKLLAPYKAKLAQIENQINEAYPLMDLISNEAKGIVSSRKDSNQNAIQILEEINLAITIINDIFKDIQQSATFYGNLTAHLNSLQKVVNDFCFAREVEKSSLLQELEAQNNAASMNASVSLNVPPKESFFNEDKMQFKSGESVFMNQAPNKYPDAGVQYNQQQPQNHAYNQYPQYIQSQPQQPPFYPQGQYQPQAPLYVNQVQPQNSYPVMEQQSNNQDIKSKIGEMPMGLPQGNKDAFQQFGGLVESTYVGRQNNKK